MLGVVILASMVVVAAWTKFKPIESADVGRLDYWEIVLLANLFSPVYSLIGTIAVYIFSFVDKRVLNKWVVVGITLCFVAAYVILANIKPGWIWRIMV
jgi:hypothetical protein